MRSAWLTTRSGRCTTARDSHRCRPLRARRSNASMWHACCRTMAVVVVVVLVVMMPVMLVPVQVPVQVPVLVLVPVLVMLVPVHPISACALVDKAELCG